MVGVVLVLFVMFVAGPIGVFLGGAIWSAAYGWFLSDDADTRAAGAESQPSAS